MRKITNHRSLMQTSFPALSVYPRVGMSRSASKTNDIFYFTPDMSSALPKSKENSIVYSLRVPLYCYGLLHIVRGKELCK